MTLSLDHLGYAGGSLEALQRAMRRLGFAPTEPRELGATAAAGGAVRSLQQRSCHLVFESSYIELTEVTQTGPDHHLAPWLASGDGLKILALGTDAVEAAQAQCAARQIECSAVAHATRQIDYGRLHGAARFTWFMARARETPEGLLCFVRNETPELVYQTEVMRHPNTALAVTELVIASAEPVATALRYARLLGVAPLADAALQRSQTTRLELAGGQLTFTDPADLGRRFGPAAGRIAAEQFAALTIQVADLDTTERILDAGAVAFHRHRDELIVSPQDAAGAAIAFRQGALVYPAEP